MTSPQFVCLLLFLVVAPVVGVNAETDAKALRQDTLPPPPDEVRLQITNEKLTRAPYAKNPNAAGRNALFYRTAPEATEQLPERLTGPAYKNRRAVYVPTDSTRQAEPAAPRLIGPRYKNRRAKSKRRNGSPNR